MKHYPFWLRAVALASSLLSAAAAAARPSAAPPTSPLRISVYATAGDVVRYLVEPESRRQASTRLARLGVTRVFLEGRRGDEYVAPERLKSVRAALAAEGIATAGGIATVPGASFGTRQNGPLGWLNWESPKTRADVAGFFRENAPIFDEIVVDDFYCTADTTDVSERARGGREWSGYRRDLLVDALEPLVFAPAREARPRGDLRLIIKFPQWYDRYQLFGYDPARMAVPFASVWVGTEVRNPETRRMGFVPPTEGYINFRWLSEVTGGKTFGAWFDHIECTPQNFVDQAYQSVLAGARELTLFRLGDVMEDHPGDALFAERLTGLRELAGRIQARDRNQHRRGVPYYKPPNSDADDNLYLMDQLAMLGLPILPVARYPAGAPVVFLGAQAAADPDLAARVENDVRQGTVAVVTPAFLRHTHARLQALAGARTGATPAPATARAIRVRSQTLPAPVPLDLDDSLRVDHAEVLLEVETDAGPRPFLTRSTVGRGAILVLNARTFSEQDFRAAGEWLLAPRPSGLVQLPEAAANVLRRVVLEPVGLRLEGPAGVSLVAFSDAVCLSSFLPQPAKVRLNQRTIRLEAHQCLWRETRRFRRDP